MEAVVTEQREAAELLVSAGANVRAADGRRWTALHYAAQECCPEIAELLLTHGADVDAADSFGNTPLWRAVFASRGRRDMIELLVKHGADPAAENTSGIYPEKLAGSIANFPAAETLRSANS
jgi:ankyrin repeat protein